MSQELSEEKRTEWKGIILKQSQSGFSIPHWCPNNNIVVYVFRYWKSKFLRVIL